MHGPWYDHIMEKVLFLDIDGVLNSKTWMLEQPRGMDFTRAVNPDAVARLTSIVKRTQCKIVVSSTWRILFSLADLRKILIAAGFPAPCPIVDATPHSNRRRGREIQSWLDTSGKRVETFCIVDDDADVEHLLPWLVQTTWDFGLLDEHVEKIVTMLGEVK